MSASGIADSGSAVDIRAMAAALRSGAAAVAQAAAVKPTVARFDRAVSAWKAEQRSERIGDAEQDRPSSASSANGREGGSGQGVFTAFLAQSIAQDGEFPDDSPSRQRQQAGAAAYRRTAGAYPGGQPQLELFVPPLSSGRALDLTV